MSTTELTAAPNSLARRFDPRSNSLNAIRLILAVSVIVSHSWVLSGRSATPAGFGNQYLGDIAVDGFFAVSGFLILGSRLSSRSLVDFFWRRVLRIWPAFVVVLIFVAVVADPFAVFVLGNGRYDVPGAIGYMFKNLGLVIVQPGIPGAPVGIPETDNWNAPLWTLSYEFACYIAIALVATVLPRRWLGPGLGVLLVGALALNVVNTWTSIDLPDPLVVLARLGAFFLCGSLLRVYRDRVPLSTWVGVVAGLLVVALIVVQTFDVFGAPFFAILLLWLGVALPLRRVGAKNDISYGVYIYAYPLQLLLAIIVGSALPIWAFALLSVAITIPFAVASWFAIERPAMRLKRLTSAESRSRKTSELDSTTPEEPAI